MGPGDQSKMWKDEMAFAAGAGRSVIALHRGMFPLDGFTRQHDPLWARALVLAQGQVRLVMVALDLTSLPNGWVVRLRSLIAVAAGSRIDHVLITATHTFSAPHIVDDELNPTLPDSANEYREAVEQAISAAVAGAVATVRPARIGVGSGESRVNVNRDVHTPDGWWLGADDRGFADPALAVVRIDDEAGCLIALLVNYSVQSSVMNEAVTGDGSQAVSGDLAGAAVRHAECRLPDQPVVLFLCGAAGDQAPYLVAHRHRVDINGHPARADIGEAGFHLVDLLGERLGSEIVRVALEVSPAPSPDALVVRVERVPVQGQQAPVSFRDLAPDKAYKFVSTGPESVPVTVLAIGSVALAALAPELSAVTGAWIRNRSPFAFTMVATMVNGSAKYLPDSTSYDRMTYEAMSSRFARGAAEGVATHIGNMLTALHARSINRPEDVHDTPGFATT